VWLMLMLHRVLKLVFASSWQIEAEAIPVSKSCLCLSVAEDLPIFVCFVAPTHVVMFIPP